MAYSNILIFLLIIGVVFCKHKPNSLKTLEDILDIASQKFSPSHQEYESPAIKEQKTFIPISIRTLYRPGHRILF
uniref:Uncharacterized protein n=1 Tax=Acrobeloides nanus TaxID=290746 RepID=A0A914D8U9_9BILA